MSSSPALVPHEPSETVSPPPARSEIKNPSYPQRIHFAERQQLEETLRAWEQKINGLSGKLSFLGNHPGRAAYERLYHQMLGARDQMADAVRRLPLETGALYDEDHELYKAAAAALERLFRTWDTVRA